MTKKVQWGVLGAANIAIKKVIPAMQHSQSCEVTALASRDLQKAKRFALELGIPRAYGSYDELLADPEIEAVYIPLPNHLHVPWSTRAAEAGKHVLCEKPIALDAGEATQLLEVRDRTGVKIEEAFMVRTHPQWLRVLELIDSGRLGEVRSVIGQFSYNNADPENIRNNAQMGGGALMDIGCYLVYCSRLIFKTEPKRVLGLIQEDSVTRTDVLTSALLDFARGHSAFTCSTRVTPSQRVQIIGTRARLEVQIPFNAPPDRPCKILIDDGSDLSRVNVEIIEVEVRDQYTIQADLFARSIRENTETPVTLEDSIKNMAVIDAIFRAAQTGRWETPKGLLDEDVSRTVSRARISPVPAS
ncbi:MAG TPA: Gfo/Idh/MocA family oxidoreductase [Pyrinomonadaceae bacterium]|jgi:predicted dehydrogenase